MALAQTVSSFDPVESAVRICEAGVQQGIFRPVRAVKFADGAALGHISAAALSVIRESVSASPPERSYGGPTWSYSKQRGETINSERGTSLIHHL
jgi:hypothetical protein